MPYSKNTLLRFFPADGSDHYTAVVTKDGILQVKPSKQFFDSVAAWLATIPGQPSETDLVLDINVSPYAKANAADWGVPGMGQLSAGWAYYLYQTIMLISKKHIKNEAMMNAYKHLVQTMITFEGKMITESRFGHPSRSWDRVLLLEPSKYGKQEPWELLPIEYYRTTGWGRFDGTEQKRAFGPAIYDAYMPLYKLMEENGILEAVRNKMNAERRRPYEMSIVRLKKKLARTEQKYEVKQARLQEEKERAIRRIQQHIGLNEERLAQLV